MERSYKKKEVNEEEKVTKFFEEKTDTKLQDEPKKNNTLLCILLITIIVVVGIVAVVIYLFDSGKLSLDLTNVSNEKVELQYTETNNKIKEGIYITDVSEVVENVMPSIVAITSKTLVSNGMFGFNFYGNDKYQEGAGSGIIVSKTNDELLILTNNHVVENTSELSVKFINDKAVDATIKGTAPKRDLAIISVKLNNLDSATLSAIKLATVGDSNELKVGNGVIAIGNALGYGQSVTTGVVSALNRSIKIDNNTNKMIQIDAAINGGNSGGALLNSKGEVVGINSAKYSSSGSSTEASIEGMGFAIPISDVKDLITDLMNGKEVNESNGPVLGVAGNMTTDIYGSYYNVPVGFYISDITKGSGAEKAGLEIGNIITEIESKPVTEFSVLSDFLSTKKAGDKVTLKIKYVSGREYKEKTVKVTLS